MWIVLWFLAFAGAAFAAVLAALGRWVAFCFFLTVFVIAVTAMGVQAVMTS